MSPGSFTCPLGFVPTLGSGADWLVSLVGLEPGADWLVLLVGFESGADWLVSVAVVFASLFALHKHNTFSEGFTLGIHSHPIGQHCISLSSGLKI